MTQAQWEHVGSGTILGHHSFFTNSLYAATRPVDNVTYRAVRDSVCNYPADMTISQDTFIKRIRDRTGLAAIDLPTEWQWEYAHRRGAEIGNVHSGAYIRKAANSLPAGKTVEEKDGMWSEDYGTCYVDRDTPSALGFYSMLGNVYEWCANASAGGVITTDGQAVENDYKGPVATGTAKQKRMRRGGCWKSDSLNYCYPYSTNSQYVYDVDADSGFRLALTISK